MAGESSPGYIPRADRSDSFSVSHSSTSVEFVPKWTASRRQVLSMGPCKKHSREWILNPLDYPASPSGLARRSLVVFSLGYRGCDSELLLGGPLGSEGWPLRFPRGANHEHGWAG